MKIISFLIIFIFCNTKYLSNTINGQITITQEKNYLDNLSPNVVTEIDNNIRSIMQDNKGNYWFGTNAEGVFRYNPTAIIIGEQPLIQFTEKDGLSNNQVLSIQEDKSGNIWFGTGLFGVNNYDPNAEQTFTTYTDTEAQELYNNSGKNWKTEKDDLWFYAGAGVHRYSNNSLVYLPLDDTNFDAKLLQSSPYKLSRYSVYCILKDKKSNLWFGTQAQGVCRYNPSAEKSSANPFTWFSEKGLAGPAVLGLFEDSKGNIWMGNNGNGLFKYDGKTLTNFTEEKGLSNKEFIISGAAGPGTMARIYSINEDYNGVLWIGTVDAGVWSYDPASDQKIGNGLTNYTIEDGLTSNAINTIYKDKKGELWFGTDEDGVCKFNTNEQIKAGGNTFIMFTIK